MAASSIMAWLWPNAWLVIPLACVTAVMCRWSVLRAETRHVLWVVVLASFLMPPFLPHPPAAAVARWLQPAPAPSTQPGSKPAVEVGSDASAEPPSTSDAIVEQAAEPDTLGDQADTSAAALSTCAAPPSAPASAPAAVCEALQPAAAGEITQDTIRITESKPVAEESASCAEYRVEPCEPLLPACAAPTPRVFGVDAPPAVSRSSVARAGPPPTSPLDHSVSRAAAEGGARHSALVAPPSAGPAPATDVDAMPAVEVQTEARAAPDPASEKRGESGGLPPAETGLEAGPTLEDTAAATGTAEADLAPSAEASPDGDDETAATGVVSPTLSPVWQAWLSALAALRDLILQLPPVPLSIWLGGIVVIAGLHLGHTGYFRFCTRHATPAPPSVAREVRLVASALQLRRLPTIEMVPARVAPLVLCGLWPRLILPQQLWEELDPHGRRAIICHELAHLRRRDHWVRWLELAVGLVYWWHPVAWWARRRLNEEADLCCDAWVTWLMPRRRRAYAEALLQTTAYLDGMRVATPAGGMAVTGRGARRIARRITMVMTHTLSPRRSLMSVTLALLLCTGGWLVRPALSCPPQETPAPPAEPTELTVMPAPAPTMSEDGGALWIAGDGRVVLVGTDGTRVEAETVEVSGGGPAVVRTPAPPQAPQPPKPAPRLRWSAGGDTAGGPAPLPPMVALAGEREITRHYQLPEGKREALTKLMLRDDVPIRVRPTDDGIEVRGTSAQQAVFADFVALLDDRTEEQEYKLPKGKAEALWELMAREDVPVHVAPADDGIEVQGNAAVQRAFRDFVQLIQDGRVAQRPGEGRRGPGLFGVPPVPPVPPVPTVPMMPPGMGGGMGPGVEGEMGMMPPSPGPTMEGEMGLYGAPQRDQEARARALAERVRKQHEAQAARARARADAQRQKAEARETESRRRELEKVGEDLERQIERLHEQLEELEERLHELEHKAQERDAAADPGVRQQHAALEEQRAAARAKLEAMQAHFAALTAQIEAAASAAEVAEAEAERAAEALEADEELVAAAPHLAAELYAQAAQGEPCSDAERSAQTLAADALGMAADSLRVHAAPQIRDAFQKATAALRGEWRKHLKEALRDFDARGHGDGDAGEALAGTLDEVAHGLEGFANGAIEDTLEHVAQALEAKAQRLREKAATVPQAEKAPQPARE